MLTAAISAQIQRQQVSLARPDKMHRVEDMAMGGMVGGPTIERTMVLKVNLPVERDAAAEQGDRAHSVAWQNGKLIVGGDAVKLVISTGMTWTVVSWEVVRRPPKP